jgi:replication factor C subunit 1
MDNLWINKYKPNSINDIIGNSNNINYIINWLNNLNDNYSIIISGNQGIGKTLIIKLILEKLNYLVHIINPNDIKDHRFYHDISEYYDYQNSIFFKLNPNNKKIALVFDEIENITLTSEKKYIMDIFKDNNKMKSFPLIFISNNQHSKLLNDLRKNCNEIIFNQPSINDMNNIIIKILKSENIKYNNIDSFISLIHFSQFDIRRLINLLQELSFHIKNNFIDDELILEFINKSRLKNTDIGLFDSTLNILNNPLDFDTVINLYESEKVLLPLMIHENYIKKINKNNSNNVLDICSSISDSISKGDNIETTIYTDQNWFLQNIHGFFTCYNISHLINKLENNNKINKIDFSLDLNKTSLKNINKKNINNLSKIINNKSNQEIILLNYMCNHFINNNQVDNLIKILYSYNNNITIKDIELCIKIDKTIDYKKLCSYQKKNINNILKTI